MIKHFIALGALWATAMLATGCVSTHKPIDPGRINHVVLFNIKDASMVSELELDCATHLRDIPTVRTYACGQHFEIGRTTISNDYMLGLLVSFEDEEGYKTYLDHPSHIALVKKWKPQFTSVTIYDIGNDSPNE